MAFTGENRDLTFAGGITEGISVKGMEAYIASLKIDLLDKVSETLNDTVDLEAAINKGWQGVSRDNFMKNFNKAIQATITDLESEYSDLTNKLTELQLNYYQQDANMVTED